MEQPGRDRRFRFPAGTPPRARGLCRCWLPFAFCLLLAGSACAAEQAQLRALLADFDGQAGLYAKDLSTGREIAIAADEPFYLASITKVLIMAAVYDKLEREGLSREHVLAFGPEDYRERSRTLRDRYDETWTVQRVIDPMINVSDTAATDLLVGFVGEEPLNAFVASLGIPGIGRITSIGALDRAIWTHVDARFAEIPFHLLERWQRDGELGAIVPAYFESDPRRRPGFRVLREAAYQAYYATGWNAATPRAIGTVLERIARRQLVSRQASEWMLETMGRTSAPRVGRRLPPTVWTHSKDGGKYLVECSAAILREGTFEMVLGVYTQHHVGRRGGELVQRAAALAYELLRPEGLEPPAPARAPRTLSPLHLLTDADNREIWSRHRDAARALARAREQAARSAFPLGETVRASLSARALRDDLPLVAVAHGPGDSYVRYQNVLRRRQLTSWSPGFTPNRPGDWTITFYHHGHPIRSATFTAE